MDRSRPVGKEEAKGQGTAVAKMTAHNDMQRRAAHELEDDAADGRRIAMVIGGGGWAM